MQRPKHHMQLRGGKYVPKPKYIDTMPAMMPDIDKLVRAVMDSLTGIAYRDDAQVIILTASKVYADKTSILIDEYSPKGTIW